MPKMTVFDIDAQRINVLVQSSELGAGTPPPTLTNTKVPSCMYTHVPRARNVAPAYTIEIVLRATALTISYTHERAAILTPR